MSTSLGESIALQVNVRFLDRNIGAFAPSRCIALIPTHNGAMDTDLRAIKAALAEVTDTELRALIDATSGVTQTAPGLLAWIKTACDWELNRREGVGYELQPPEVAIPPEEDAVSIAATMTMRATFAQDSGAVLALLDALVELLTGASNLH